MTTPQAPSEAQESPKPDRSSGSVFKRQYGPLPLWAWMGIGLAIALAYYFWKQNGGSIKGIFGGGSTSGNTVSPDQTTAASQIPQFVNQTFVQDTPPPTPVDNDHEHHRKEHKPGDKIQPHDTYMIVTNGKESLATIAKKAGIPIEQIVQGTAQFGGTSNHDSFFRWYNSSKSGHGTKGHVPKGITLFASGFQVGHPPTGWTQANLPVTESGQA